MRILKNKIFQRWAKDISLDDQNLVDAIEEMENGLFEASLGGGIYKKRMGIGNRGKSGGIRTIVAFKMNDKAFFVHGFAKNEKANISDKEKEELKSYAKLLFGLDEKQIKYAIQKGELVEVQP